MDIKDKIHFRNRLMHFRINKVLTNKEYLRLVELTKNDLNVARCVLKTIILTS